MRLSRQIAFLTIGAAAVPLFAQNGPGPGSFNPAPGVVSAAETTRLIFMREEEKLARDVYLFLDQKWNLRIFRNIARSEETHFRTVGMLLTRYNIADPSDGKPVGEFSDPRFTAMYQELTTKGVASIKDALEVGVLIEKVDIADLEAALVEATQPDVKRVYTNLLSASYNHLESFETTLEVLAPTR